MMRSLALLAALAFCGSCAPAQPNRVVETQDGLPAIPTKAPLGGGSLGVEWRSVEAPGVGTILMAVARPTGDGPFPAVLILHGSHGFAREYVQLAKELSQDGIVAVAACWFAPGSGPGTRFVSPMACPAGTPAMPAHQSPQANRTIEAVVSAVRGLPEVRSDQLAVFGHSRGGGAAWNYVLKGGQARAVILNSAGYPDDLIHRAAQFDAPVLILHGERDGPEDGGSVMTDVTRVRAFQAGLRKAGKPVEAVIYEGGRHNDLFVNPSQHADEVRQMRAFLRQHLRN